MITENQQYNLDILGMEGSIFIVPENGLHIPYNINGELITCVWTRVTQALHDPAEVIMKCPCRLVENKEHMMQIIAKKKKD